LQNIASGFWSAIGILETRCSFFFPKPSWLRLLQFGMRNATSCCPRLFASGAFVPRLLEGRWQMNNSTTCETMKEAGGQMGAKACGALQSAQETAGEWTQKAQGNLESLTKAASDYVEQGQRKAQELGRSVSGKVQERPAAALLVAAGLGFLLGVILKRR
jgi:ElaB/YqjD/DUF883 family membrane-anchored ribosome-binding protein